MTSKRFITTGLLFSFVFSAGCASVSVKKAYNGKLNVDKAVAKNATQGFSSLLVRVKATGPEYQKFVNPIQFSLALKLPAVTPFKDVSDASQPKTASVSRALLLTLEPTKYNGDNIMKFGSEGLTMKVSLTNPKTNAILGSGEILATPQTDSVSVGGFKTGPRNKDEDAVGTHTALFVAEFLNGKD